MEEKSGRFVITSQVRQRKTNPTKMMAIRVSPTDFTYKNFTYNEDLKSAQNAGNCICGVIKIQKFSGPP